MSSYSFIIMSFLAIVLNYLHAMVIRKKAVENEELIMKVQRFLETLNIKYNNPADYVLAFVHRSIVNEKSDFTPEHNERLEFLWDAVLELAITKNLYMDFPEKHEGDLTDMRSALVRWKNLSSVAKRLWIQEHLLLWKWEELSWGRENEYILANTVESFLWALYLDAGMIEATKFVNTYIYTTLDNILKNNLFKDFKTLIQEYAQAQYDITPTYKVLDDSWPDHDKNFLVWVFLWEKKVWEWNGSSKKKAQEDAAERWYAMLTK